MNDILKYRRCEGEDYYKLLGCHETATTDQIMAEYKVLSLIYHPDKNSSENSAEKFQKIQKAKEILTDPEKRCLYDKWYRSGFCIPFEQFMNMNKSAHTSIHWMTKKKDLMLKCEGACNQDDQSQDGDGSSPKIKCQNVIWERDPGSESLRKFRTYEI